MRVFRGTACGLGNCGAPAAADPDPLRCEEGKVSSHLPETPVSRRTLIASTAAAGGASAVGGLLTGEPAQAAPAGVPSRTVTLRINGRQHSTTVDNRTSLLDLL